MMRGELAVENYSRLAGGVAEAAPPSAPPPPPPPPTFPNPPPKAPTGGLSDAANAILGFLKWVLVIVAVGALIFIGIQMIVGRRRRNEMAVEGALSIPWVALGLVVGLGAPAILLFLLGY